MSWVEHHVLSDMLIYKLTSSCLHLRGGFVDFLPHKGTSTKELRIHRVRDYIMVTRYLSQRYQLFWLKQKKRFWKTYRF